MAVLRAYKPTEWVVFGECTCKGECECTAFQVHRLGPTEMRELTKRHSFKRKERWPDGWREEVELKDSFSEEYCKLVIQGWRNVFGPNGDLIEFSPENLALVREATGLRFQEFLNDLVRGTQELHAEIEKAEIKNSHPG